MTEALFGTDGYRGLANDLTETGINPDTFGELAVVYTNLITEQTGQPPTIIVGSDTRISSSGLREAVCIGAASAGAEVWHIGVAPTPVIAWLAKKYHINAIAITASHNPGEDNGFKPFDVGGLKPARGTLEEIEKRYYDDMEHLSGSGRIIERTGLKEEYLKHTVEALGGDEVLAGRSVIIDGANGAAYDMAPRLYERLGARVIKFACTDDGRLINKGNGAAHLEGVREFISDNPSITQVDSFLGAFASDGDGDRVMGVDRLGRTIDGNYWLHQLAADQLGIVGTIYTNSALRHAVKKMGVEFHECDNGDSYVTAKLQELTKERGLGYTRGGEFTGHLIDTGHLPSGDGLYMGGLMAAILAGEGSGLTAIRDGLQLWPEKMVGLRVNGTDAKALVAKPAVQDAKKAAEAILGNKGRVIVRPSGTEPLVRIWAESKDGELLPDIIERLSQAVQAA